MIRVITAEEVRALAPMPQLIESLRVAFRKACVAPARQVTEIPGGAGDRLLLYMPAFDAAGGGVAKLATIFPDNTERGLPTIQAVLVVFSQTGTPVAILDGATVTRLRTGAASALASSYLSRPESEHLLIVGTGALAPYMALAHCAVRPISRVSVWGRAAKRAEATVAEIRLLLAHELDVEAVSSLEDTVPIADIISCATSSVTPVLAGKWLRAGTFVDLVGSFSPSKREADDEVVVRSRLFVDTFQGALAEAGDLINPLARGVIDGGRIEAELADLVCGRSAGRGTEDEIIVFKSVGTAIEDLAAAWLIVGMAEKSSAAHF